MHEDTQNYQGRHRLSKPRAPRGGLDVIVEEGTF
jgi:hypothetical protein